MKILICFLTILSFSNSLFAQAEPISIEWRRINTPIGKTAVNRLECRRKCVWTDASSKKHIARTKLEKLLRQVVKIQVADSRFPRLEVIVFYKNHEKKSQFALPSAYSKELQLFLQLEKLAAQSKEQQ